MARQRDYAGLSDLEEEFELELESADEDQELDDLDRALEANGPDERELEEFETGGEDDEASAEFEYGGSGYIERLMELSAREFESEAEMEAGVRDVLDDIQTEYFLGRLKKLAKKGLSAGAKHVMRRVKQAAGNLPMGQAIKGVLASRNLTDLLKNAATGGLKMALKSHPALAAVSTIGGSLLRGAQREHGGTDREPYEQFVSVAGRAYEVLADNLNPASLTPDGASQQAAAALQAAVQQVQDRARAGTRGSGSRAGTRRVRVVRLGPGERVLIIGR